MAAAAVDSNMRANQQQAVVVGGGPAGAMMALYLAQRGFKVDLFEAKEEASIAGPTARSWNVVLMGRGLEAIETGGVDLHAEVCVWVEAESRINVRLLRTTPTLLHRGYAVFKARRSILPL